MRNVNRIGQQYGRLVVFEKSGVRGGGRLWICRCECGNEIIVQGNNLHSGNTQSCGCSRKPINKTHGLTGTSIYNIWRQMIQSCTNPKASSYDRYGAKGINVCDHWRAFANFYADMGDRPEGMSIDRINSSGDYEPGNCQWSTPTEQNRNRSSNRMETLWGKTQSLADWADELNIDYQLVHRRIRDGWNVQTALTTPSAKGRK